MAAPISSPSRATYQPRRRHGRDLRIPSDPTSCPSSFESSVATRFGWAGNPDVTWKDIAAKARAGQLGYGMTNPAASNSGFSALVGVAAAMAGTGDALRTEDVDERGLTVFFNGQTLTAGSSGWLADGFVTGQAKLDGLINYESVLLGLNA